MVSRSKEWLDRLAVEDPERYAEVRARRIATCKRNSRKASVELKLWRMARSRAQAKGLRFDIKVTDIRIPSHCPVLGIPLYKQGGTRSHNSPSLDRIRNNLGYTRGNIVVISDRANRLKGDASPTELAKLASFYALDCIVAD